MPSIAEPKVGVGHVELKWDPDNADEVKNARAHFETLKKQGHIFFRVNPDAKDKKGKPADQFPKADGELICEFDPKADMLATRPVVGG